MRSKFGKLPKKVSCLKTLPFCIIWFVPVTLGKQSKRPMLCCRTSSTFYDLLKWERCFVKLQPHLCLNFGIAHGAILGYQIPPKIWNFQDLILLNPRFENPSNPQNGTFLMVSFFSVVLPLSTMATMKLNSRANLDPKKLRIFELAYGQDSDDDDSCASAWCLVSQIPHKNRHSSQKTAPWSFARNLHVTPLKKDEKG